MFDGLSRTDRRVSEHIYRNLGPVKFLLLVFDFVFWLLF